MKDSIGDTLDIDLENGERVQIEGTTLGEPAKALVVERALELAALSSRSGAPERDDFERAARELSADAKVMDRGDGEDGDSESRRAEKGSSSTQVLNNENAEQ